MPPCTWIDRSQAATAASAQCAFAAAAATGARGVVLRDAPRGEEGERAAELELDEASSRAGARPPGRCRSACRTARARSRSRPRARAPAPRHRTPRARARPASARAGAAAARSSRGAGPAAPPVTTPSGRVSSFVSRISRSAPSSSQIESPPTNAIRVGRVEIGDERPGRERPARLAARDLRLQVGRERRQDDGHRRPVRRVRERATDLLEEDASSRNPSPAPPSASDTETPVQPSSASSCHDGCGFAARNARAWSRSSSCSGVREKSISATSGGRARARR